MGTRSSEKTTSAAVKSLPSWNLTFRRSLNSQVSSSTVRQDSARSGTRRPFASLPTSVSNTWLPTLLFGVRLWKCGSMEVTSAPSAMLKSAARTGMAPNSAAAITQTSVFIPGFLTPSVRTAYQKRRASNVDSPASAHLCSMHHDGLHRPDTHAWSPFRRSAAIRISISLISCAASCASSPPMCGSRSTTTGARRISSRRWARAHPEGLRCQDTRTWCRSMGSPGTAILSC